MIEHAVGVTQIEKRETPFDTIYAADQKEAILLTYYQNNSLHVFALASLLARMVRFNKLTQVKQLISNCEVLQPFIEAETMTTWNLEQDVTRALNVLTEHGVVVDDGGVIKVSSPASKQYANLTDLAEIIEPTLERFHIAMALLKHGALTSTQEVENAASEIAQRLSSIYGLSAPEFFDKKMFTRFIETLRTQRLIDEGVGVNNESGLERLSYIVQAYLDTDVSYNVFQAMPAHAHQIDSPSPTS
jgi:glycerol-3-phosphate O-acyltransferase